MRKLLFLFPAAAAALFLTGCDEVSYRERTVVYDDRPAVYGGGDDFYYVSSRPYSRSYGQLYLRSGRYYYSRGGTYHVYSRPTYRHGHDHHRHVYNRHVEHDRHDRDHRRDRDGDRDWNRSRYENVSHGRHDGGRNRDGIRNRQQHQQFRDHRHSVGVDRNRNEYRPGHVEVRSPRVNQQPGAGRRNFEGNQRARQPQVQQAVYRQSKTGEGENRRKRDRDKRED